jgi:hypothetical protein
MKQGLEGQTRAQISKELGGRSIFPDPLHSLLQKTMDLQTFSLTWHHGKSLDHAKNCQFQVFEEVLEPRIVPST